MDQTLYISNLKQSVTALRRVCLRHMQQVYGQRMNQPDWKYAANVYAKHNGPSINPDHLKWDWPVPISNSKVDIYHHGYFIRATLASILYPDEPLLYEAYLLAPLCSIEDNELIRREHQVALYTKLADLIPTVASTAAQAPKPPQWAIDLTAIHLKLDKILTSLSKLEATHDMDPTNTPQQTRPVDRQDKAVVDSGDPGGKLAPAKQTSGKGRHKRPTTK